MVPVASFSGEHDAGGAVPHVAGVVWRVVAGARAAARRRAGRGARPARHRRQQHLRAALATQLCEVEPWAGCTAARVAELLAAVLLAGQQAAAHHAAAVRRRHAAYRPTLVAPT